MKKLENKDQIELHEFRSWAYDDDSCAIDKLYEIAEPLLSSKQPSTADQIENLGMFYDLGLITSVLYSKPHRQNKKRMDHAFFNIRLKNEEERSTNVELHVYIGSIELKKQQSHKNTAHIEDVIALVYKKSSELRDTIEEIRDSEELQKLYKTEVEPLICSHVANVQQYTGKKKNKTTNYIQTIISCLGMIDEGKLFDNLTERADELFAKINSAFKDTLCTSISHASMRILNFKVDLANINAAILSIVEHQRSSQNLCIYFLNKVLTTPNIDLEKDDLLVRILKRITTNKKAGGRDFVQLEVVRLLSVDAYMSWASIDNALDAMIVALLTPVKGSRSMLHRLLSEGISDQHNKFNIQHYDLLLKQHNGSETQYKFLKRLLKYLLDNQRIGNQKLTVMELNAQDFYIRVFKELIDQEKVGVCEKIWSSMDDSAQSKLRHALIKHFDKKAYQIMRVETPTKGDQDSEHEEGQDTALERNTDQHVNGTELLIDAIKKNDSEQIKRYATADTACSFGQDRKPMLVIAIESGTISLVKKLLELGAVKHINTVDNSGKTPLHYAIQSGKGNIIELLVKRGADMILADENGETPLTWAVKSNRIKFLRKMLKLSPYAKMEAGVENESPSGLPPYLLYVAVMKNLECLNVAVIDLLLEYKLEGAAEPSGTGYTQTLLNQVIVCSNTKLFQYLLNNGADVNEADLSGLIPLYTAAQKGHGDFVRQLVERGADINKALAPTDKCISSSEKGATALWGAAAGGQIDVVKYLVEKSADINKASNGGMTPLYIAAAGGQTDVVKYLVEKSADINKASNDGMTPLHIAACVGNINIVRYLVEEGGADVRRTNKSDKDPLSFAKIHKHTKVVAYLNQKINNIHDFHIYIANGDLINIKKYIKKDHSIIQRLNELGYSPLHVAAQQGQIEAVKYLVKNGADINKIGEKGWTPLCLAVQQGHVEIVKCLLENKADINKADYRDATPLIFAAQQGHDEIVKYLLEYGADLHKADNEGVTPLFAAVEYGHIDVLKYLIKNNADITEANKHGSTPLHWAANSSCEVVEFLIAMGANANMVDHYGGTPLLIAIQQGRTDIIKYLVNNGANVNHSCLEGRTPLYTAAQQGQIEAVKCLVKNRADINQCCNNGLTPLYIAAQHGHTDIIKYLVNNGANVNQGCNEGVTPLHIVAQVGNIEVVKCLVENGDAKVNQGKSNGVRPLYIAAQQGHTNVIKYLVDNGASVNQGYNNGYTPLHIATQKGQIEAVKCLIEKGADVNQSTNSGATPLHIANKERHTEIYEYLVRMGASRDWNAAEISLFNNSEDKQEVEENAIKNTAADNLAL